LAQLGVGLRSILLDVASATPVRLSLDRLDLSQNPSPWGLGTKLIYSLFPW